MITYRSLLDLNDRKTYCKKRKEINTRNANEIVMPIFICLKGLQRKKGFFHPSADERNHLHDSLSS